MFIIEGDRTTSLAIGGGGQGSDHRHVICEPRHCNATCDQLFELKIHMYYFCSL